MCEVQELVRDRLKRNGLQNNEDYAWEIRKSKFGGRGVFATRDIRAGDLIFADYPIILGPRTCPGDICVACYKTENLRPCSKNCGLPVCSTECENSDHADECAKINGWKSPSTEISENLIRCLTPIRSLFLDESELKLMVHLAAHLNPVHGSEVNVLKYKMMLEIPQKEETIMRMACAVMDANAFEVIIGDDAPSLRGLYPLSSLMNHHCAPNTMHVFDHDKFMLLRAIVDIKKDEEIYTSYCRFIWGTLSRRFHLQKTKHFSCLCQRCKDPTEFGTYMNSLYCTKCNGKVVPVNPLKIKSEWKCEMCTESVPQATIGFITTSLANRLATLDTDDLEEILKFYEGRIAKIVPETNQIFLELKYRVIWMLGFRAGYLLSEISPELLYAKEKYCYDILEVLEKLGMGACKMRGLLLLEIVRCIDEKKKRGLGDANNNEEPIFDTEKKMVEISNIFLFDVSAPKEVKSYWKLHNINTSWRNYL